MSSNVQIAASVRSKPAKLVPPLVSILVLILLCWYLVHSSIRANNGHLVYPLDDTYITMAMSKNLATAGVWGVTPYEFASASSTPLYVFVIAGCFLLAGVHAWWPMVIAFGFAALALLVANSWLSALPVWMRTVGLVGLCVLVPIDAVAFTGMEHCLHICLCLVFLRLASIVIETNKADWRIPVLIPLMVLVRFESLFLIGICAGLLLLRKQYGLAADWLGMAILALGSYSTFSLINGWAWLPNSVLLKGNVQHGNGVLGIVLSLGGWALTTLVINPHILAVVVVLLLVLAGTRTKANIWQRDRVAIVITILAIFAHLQFAMPGWLFRYEAYLLAMGLCSLLAAIPLLRSKNDWTPLIIISGVVLLCLLGGRSAYAHWAVRKASFNIYEQQYQMGMFLKAYYPTGSVAANDIGCITFNTNIRLVDLVGLADWRVFEAKRKREYTTAVIQSETGRNNSQIAIVYDDWFGSKSMSEWGGPSLPSNWVRVSRWEVSDSYILGGSIVSFYAVRPNQVERLRASLNAFAPTLPESVKVLPQ